MSLPRRLHAGGRYGGGLGAGVKAEGAESGAEVGLRRDRKGQRQGGEQEQESSHGRNRLGMKKAGQNRFFVIRSEAKNLSVGLKGKSRRIKPRPCVSSRSR